MRIKSLAKNCSPRNFAAGVRTTGKLTSDGCSVFNYLSSHYENIPDRYNYGVFAFELINFAVKINRVH